MSETKKPEPNMSMVGKLKFIGCSLLLSSVIAGSLYYFTNNILYPIGVLTIAIISLAVICSFMSNDEFNE